MFEGAVTERSKILRQILKGAVPPTHRLSIEPNLHGPSHRTFGTTVALIADFHVSYSTHG